MSAVTLRRAAMLACSTAGLAMLATPVPAMTREYPLSIRNNFRIGTSGVACSAQNAAQDSRLSGMFDRGYLLTCRDAAGAVGSAISVRRDLDIQAEASMINADADECGPVETDTIDELGTVSKLTCRDPESSLDYRRYAVSKGGSNYLVEGLAGYDPALRLALASIALDRRVEGEIRVATTEVSDSAAFARVQAGLLDAGDARAEAYFRNNGGRYGEAAEFFETLVNRETDNTLVRTEALANQGLQQSNLGNFNAAARMFDEAAGFLAQRDIVGQRLLRNFRAIDQLNQRNPQAAIEVLNTEMVAIDDVDDREALSLGYINLPISDQINRENIALQRIGGTQQGLTPKERAIVLDAQARALRGTAIRQQGDLPAAEDLLFGAIESLRNVRNGHLHSVGFLVADIQMERALIAEARGLDAQAERAYDAAIEVATLSFPESPLSLAAEARKAAFLARNGRGDDARALFGNIVERSASVTDAGPALRELLSPYFDLLAQDGTEESAISMFDAAQVLQRPGVAQTQAVLARGLSEGNDEASAIFRLSVARTRSIARTQTEIANLSAKVDPDEQVVDQLAAARNTLAELQREQTELTARLGEFPRYRVLAPARVTVFEMQASLEPGEAYSKIMDVGGEIYALYITPEESFAYRPDISAEQLEEEVEIIRDSIVTIEDGQQLTYPFDVESARKLYQQVYGPVHDRIASARHLIVEPDGAMLQLPPYLLITEDRGVDAYLARTENPAADPYDFTGIDWLGRGRQVSIAVSPRGFLDIRELGPSQARTAYLGLGHNKMPTARPVAAVADECTWPLETWLDPIAADELYFARDKFGSGDVVTDGAFTDSRLLSEGDLDQYRVLHFATHGLVTAPRPSCPAKPALVTSFGDMGSDGLLNFREIFDLNLDADVVILSACDTAGLATAAASRDAGVTTGGNYALDGLVRAFVGAGARSVVASHWPVPDNYDATKRLIGGLIDAAPGEAMALSLSRAQETLMDDPQTSHPFYWSAFIILGDGEKPLIQPANMGG